MPTHLDRAGIQAAEVPGLQQEGASVETHRRRVALLHDAEAEEHQMKICDVCGAKPELEKPVYTHAIGIGTVHVDDEKPIALEVDLCGKCAERIEDAIERLLSDEFNLRLPK